MSEAAGGDEPVTRAEFVQLTEELRQAMTELREANTPAETREAKRDVAEAQADLEAAAASLGISTETLRKAAAAARREERREELTPLVRELLAEERKREADEAAEAQRLADYEASGSGKPKPKPKEKGAPAAEVIEDQPPVAAHWIDRPLGELIK